MRAMGTTWAVTSQAVKARQEAEDRGKGWKRVDTKGHCDKLDIAPWYGSGTEPADVTIDNDNKRHTNVFWGLIQRRRRRCMRSIPYDTERYERAGARGVHEVDLCATVQGDLQDRSDRKVSSLG